MGGLEPFEQKHETLSEYSMDSGFHSQTGASRRGNAMPEGYSTLTPQDNRSRMGSQYLYSPTLSSENFNPFSEQQSEAGQMHLPSTATELETGDNTFFANYSAGQEFPQYTSTNVARFASTSGVDAGSFWGVTESAQNFNTQYNFASYPRSAQSLEGTMFSTQDQSDMMFQHASQRQVNRLQLDTTVRPTAVRHSSSYNSHQQGIRRPSANESGFGAFVMSPASAISVPLPSAPVDNYEQFLESGIEKEEPTSASHPAESINDEDEILSASDALEAKTMDEEQGKLARSHPLYQAQPDDNGKYHCPNEGKAGCNHKPTPLKCNYDKYVDSHLKPFRCNKKACIGVQFSSTACLLRHEREAHGMHGHGARPHLCHFADCERSVPGNGFPRRYNLFDHMKRVHDYTGPTTEPSPARAEPATSRKGTIRKRKSTADEGAEKRQKIAKPNPQIQQEQKKKSLEQNFLTKKQSLINLLAVLNGPSDLTDDTQLHKEIDLLIDISTQYKKNLG